MWLERNFDSAVEQGSIHNDDDRPMCSFWAELNLTRSDGVDWDEVHTIFNIP